MKKKIVKRSNKKSQAKKPKKQGSRKRPNKRNYIVLDVDGEDFALTKVAAAKFLQEVVNELSDEETDAFISYFNGYE